MKFAVIGASAGVGLELVKQLLDHGHTVNTLSRSIGTIPEHERVHKMVGSALNEADIAQAIDGVDAILVTLGTGTSRKATGLYIQSPRAILNAIKRQDPEAARAAMWLHLTNSRDRFSAQG